MAKAKKTKKTVTKKQVKLKSKTLVSYVENSVPKIIIFLSPKKAWDFIKKFEDKHSDPYNGWWIDYAVTGIHGKIYSFENTFVTKLTVSPEKD